MGILEFAERTSKIPIRGTVLELLKMYDEAEKNGKQIICIMPKGNGRTMIKNIIEKYNASRKPVDE